MTVKIMLLVPDKETLLKLSEAITQQSNNAFKVITELPIPTIAINAYSDPVFYVRKRVTGDDIRVFGENITLEHDISYFNFVANFEHLSYGYSINVYKNTIGKTGLRTDIINEDFYDLFDQLNCPKLDMERNGT